ncbi:hypothetical protein ONE63_008501 [Megalurothrips usitatus]|uniref:protein-histidine N-methyltransferase n=1 Tax=Megalurothrips usitatus TaxID=439358 RepID=A0AAV7XNV7_9NEOP|nr:hypothetical protein ONE63_008501 [Megalurothrips usitatus]
MFKFSFPNPDGDACLTNEGESTTEQSLLQWIPSEKIPVLPSHLKYMLAHQDSVNHMKVSNLTLAHISTKSAVKCATEETGGDNGVKLAEELHSDLVPAKYEGGLKIWECTEDLLDWLLSNRSYINLQGKYVLDLGCGAGLLGIAALKDGANVIFQDYNKEVIDSCTIPNVLLNLTNDESQKLIENGIEKKTHCEFYSGDWSSFTDKIQEGREKELKFDFILTSETIYNPENHQKLCNVFKKCLKTSGCVYLAAKTYYFGVGGGLRQFENLLKEDGFLKSEICWKCPSGVSREIIKISFTS